VNKTGNKNWKQKRKAEFNRQKKAMGFGPGFLHSSMVAAINQQIAPKFPQVKRPEVDPPAWIMAKKANEQMHRAALRESNDPYADQELLDEEEFF